MTPESAHMHDEPQSLADVVEMRVYRLRTAANLLGLHPDTLLAHGVTLLPKPTRTSPLRVLGREILRMAGVREIERCTRSAGVGESQAERERRAAEAVKRIKQRCQ